MATGAAPGGSRPPMLNGQRIEWTPKDVFFGVLWFIFLFLVAPLPFVLPFVGAYGSDSDEVFVVSIVASAFAEVGLLLVAARYTFGRHGGSWERLGIRGPTWGTLGWAAAALIAAFIFAMVYGAIIEWLDVEQLKAACDEQVSADVQNNAALLAIASVVFVTFAPVCEETFFRGFVFPGLMRWSVPVAVIVSAALFSVAHASVKAFIPIFAIGMIFATTYFRSGNLISTMLAHFAYNCISVSVMWAGDCQSS